MALVGIPNTLALLSSTIPENDAPAWVQTEPYTAGQKCMYEHKIFLALRDNTGKIPTQNVDDWEDEGATNKYRALDDFVSSTSSATGVLTFSVKAERCNVIALFEVYARFVDIVIEDETSGEVYHSSTTEMWESDTVDWWTYFFLPLREKRDMFLYLDFPMINPKITITLRNDTDGDDDAVAIGHFVAAMAREIGIQEWNAATGANDYSVYDTDKFGRSYLKVGKWSKRGEFDLHAETYTVDTVYRLLADCRGRPILYVGDDRQGGDGSEPIGFESMLIFGVLRTWQTYYQNSKISKINVQIGGNI